MTDTSTQPRSTMYAAADYLDEALFAMRHLIPGTVRDSTLITSQADNIEEAMDLLIMEPHDVRDLRYAMRLRGYDSHTPMLPTEESIEYLLDAADYAAAQDVLRAIRQNTGLLLTVETSTVAGEVDQHGMPYIRVVVSREVQA